MARDVERGGPETAPDSGAVLASKPTRSNTGPIAEQYPQPAHGPRVIATLRKNARERLRIAIDRYQGVDLIDLRVTVDLTVSSGIQIPTKKGVSLRVGMLPALIAALQEAAAVARHEGLLDG